MLFFIRQSICPLWFAPACTAASSTSAASFGSTLTIQLWVTPNFIPLRVFISESSRRETRCVWLWMAERGAARHLPQAELTPERLAAELRAATRADLLAMAERARSLARPQAAARVADELERLVAA